MSIPLFEHYLAFLPWRSSTSAAHLPLRRISGTVSAFRPLPAKNIFNAEAAGSRGPCVCVCARYTKLHCASTQFVRFFCGTASGIGITGGDCTRNFSNFFPPFYRLEKEVVLRRPDFPLSGMLIGAGSNKIPKSCAYFYENSKFLRTDFVYLECLFFINRFLNLMLL
jgi:hypothetical protein